MNISLLRYALRRSVPALCAVLVGVSLTGCNAMSKHEPDSNALLASSVVVSETESSDTSQTERRNDDTALTTAPSAIASQETTTQSLPQNPAEQVSDAVWAQAYLEMLETLHTQGDNMSCLLFYLDADNVPELMVRSDNDTERFYTYANGSCKMFYQFETERPGYASGYVEKQGYLTIIVRAPIGGVTEIKKLENGVLKDEVALYSTQDPETDEPIYLVNDEEVSQSEFRRICMLYPEETDFLNSVDMDFLSYTEACSLLRERISGSTVTAIAPFDFIQKHLAADGSIPCTTAGKDFNNPINGGFITNYGDYVCFRGIDGFLYSVKKCLLQHEVVYLVQSPVDDRLYFYDKTEKAIASIDLFGENYRIEYRGDARELTFYEGSLYFSNDSGIFRMSPGNAPKQLYAGNVWYLTVSDLGLVFTDLDKGRNLLNISTDGYESEYPVVKDTVYDVCTYSEYGIINLLFTMGESRELCKRYTVSDGEPCPMGITGVRWVNCDDRNVYYTHDKKGGIYQVSLDDQNCVEHMLLSPAEAPVVNGIFFSCGTLLWADQDYHLHMFSND